MKFWKLTVPHCPPKGDPERGIPTKNTSKSLLSHAKATWKWPCSDPPLGVGEYCAPVLLRFAQRRASLLDCGLRLPGSSVRLRVRPSVRSRLLGESESSSEARPSAGRYHYEYDYYVLLWLVVVVVVVAVVIVVVVEVVVVAVVFVSSFCVGGAAAAVPDLSGKVMVPRLDALAASAGLLLGSLRGGCTS